jgi:hypothetical protein
VPSITVDKFDVILPAGGKLDDHFARVALTENKALIKVQDYMVGMKSVFAARESKYVNRVVLVGPQAVRDAMGNAVTIALNDTGDLTQNIKLALRELQNQGEMTKRVVILTTDLPFLEAKHLDAFLELCPESADVAAAIVTEEEYIDRFPSSDSTWAKLTDGNFTIGGAYVINPEVFVRTLPKIEEAVANRKSILKLAGMVGLGFALKYKMRKLSLGDVVSKLEEIIGCKVKPITGAPAELAFDIDDIKDYEYALANK